MKGGFIGIVFLAIGILALLYHQNEVERAYSDGYYRASNEFSRKLDKVRRENYEKGFLGGKLKAEARCQREKQDVYNVAFQKGQLQGEMEAGRMYDLKLQRIMQEYEEKFAKAQISHETELEATVRRLEEEHRKELSIIRIQSSASDSLKTKPKLTSSNPSIRKSSSIKQLTNTQIKVIIVLIGIVLAPFFAAIGLGIVYNKKFR